MRDAIEFAAQSIRQIRYSAIKQKRKSAKYPAKFLSLQGPQSLHAFTAYYLIYGHPVSNINSIIPQYQLVAV